MANSHPPDEEDTFETFGEINDGKHKLFVARDLGHNDRWFIICHRVGYRAETGIIFKCSPELVYMFAKGVVDQFTVN